MPSRRKRRTSRLPTKPTAPVISASLRSPAMPAPSFAHCAAQRLGVQPRRATDACLELRRFTRRRLQRLLRRRRSRTIYGTPHAVQVELSGVRAHVPEPLLQNCARILFRCNRPKVAPERAVLYADALELLHVRNKGRNLLRMPQRALPAEQRCGSYTRELCNFEVEECAAIARPAAAHAGPAQASLQDAEGQDFEITRGPYAVSCREGSGSAPPSRTYIPRARDGSCSISSTAFHELTRDGNASPPNGNSAAQ
jgi:hypothetical protein